jgi:tRNA-Thr(GGU) m(6)t(6)A37 methyltransferase TsaA
MTKKMTIEPIGWVLNDIDEPLPHHEIKKQESIIVVDEAYMEGFLGIDKHDYVDVVFYFHRADPYQLTCTIHTGETQGVFASRSPRRPNSIGVTTVKLLGRKSNRLYVRGLDAVNQTPVLDIKCVDTSVFESEKSFDPVHASIIKTNPRIDIHKHILQEDTETLLLKTGHLHGHYCPGIAMGVMASVFAINSLIDSSEEMDDFVVRAETMNCFLDGVQFVTGCTCGNNKLQIEDRGHTAFNLSGSDGRGIRIVSKESSQQAIKGISQTYEALSRKVVDQEDASQEDWELYKKAAVDRAFATLSIPVDRLFSIAYT